MRCWVKSNIVLIIFVLVSLNIWGQAEISKRQLRKEKRLQHVSSIMEFLKKDTIAYEANRCYPSSWVSVDLTLNPNYLRIYTDSVSASLPYFGTAYQATPGERGGIYFDSKVDSISLEKNEKKGFVRVSFKVKGPKDTYNCKLMIFDEGEAELSITSIFYQSISYTGYIVNWDLPEIKKKKMPK